MILKAIANKCRCRHSLLKNRTLFYWFIAVFSVVIFWPTLHGSYAMDSIDRLIHIAQSPTLQDQIAYSFQREDCHFMPLYLLLHVVFYNLFWLNPVPFHFLIIITFILCGLTLMKLIFELTSSRVTMVFAGILFCWQTSYLKLLDIVCWPYLFTLLLILLALLSVYRYTKTGHLRWVVLASFMAFLAPCSYSIGVPIGLWVVGFYFLCVPAENRKGFNKTLKILIPVFCSWLVGVWVYYSVTHPAQVFLERVPNQSLVNFSYITQAVWLTGKSLWSHGIPLMTSSKDLSLSLAYFLIIMAVIKRKSVSWRIVLFFFIWSVGNYLFAYYARGNFGARLINAEWYHFYPFTGLVAIYAVMAADIFKGQELKGFQFKKAVVVAAIFAAIFYGYNQRQIILNRPVAQNDLYAIGTEFRDLITRYFNETRQEKLILSDRPVSLEGLYPSAKSLKLYAALFLPKALYDKIIWGEETDKNFIYFWQTNENKYIIPLLTDSKLWLMRVPRILIEQ